jgi:Plasmid recombination enzyme.
MQGQLKVQGAEEKQTKFLDKFLVYPSYEKITKRSLEKQEAFFKEVLKAVQKKFPYRIILSAHVHRNEIFHPKDEEMKALFPEGKVTPHINPNGEYIFE